MLEVVSFSYLHYFSCSHFLRTFWGSLLLYSAKSIISSKSLVFTVEPEIGVEKIYEEEICWDRSIEERSLEDEVFFEWLAVMLFFIIFLWPSQNQIKTRVKSSLLLVLLKLPIKISLPPASRLWFLPVTSFYSDHLAWSSLFLRYRNQSKDVLQIIEAIHPPLNLSALQASSNICSPFWRLAALFLFVTALGSACHSLRTPPHLPLYHGTIQYYLQQISVKFIHPSSIFFSLLAQPLISDLHIASPRYETKSWIYESHSSAGHEFWILLALLIPKIK